MNFYLITSLYVGVGGLAVGIFLWGKPDGNSMFDRAYRIVCVHLPWLLKKILEKSCGKRAPQVLDKIWDYLCYQSNPLVQIFYLCVLVGGYMTFVFYGYPHLPNRLAGSFHKYTGFAVFTTCVTVWWKACSTDPGTVTPYNLDDLLETYKWDEQIFSSAYCKTCQLIKPARSKHCSLCNVCIAKFDHHCIWINNCVGVGNHKWFLSFLFWHLVICGYGCGLGTTIAYDIVGQKDLFNAVFVDPITKERHPATYMIIGQYMLATEGMLIFIIVLGAIMGLVLFGFFLWHLNLVRIGTTTNEMSKWNYVKWCLKHEGEEGKAKIKALTNEYNQGCFANYKEVFFPIDVHKLPRQLAAEAAPAEKPDSKQGKSIPRKGGKDKVKKG